VAKVVAPKRAKLAEAEGTYEDVMAGLRKKQGELQASGKADAWIGTSYMWQQRQKPCIPPYLRPSQLEQQASEPGNACTHLAEPELLHDAPTSRAHRCCWRDWQVWRPS
jgi:hypothetical protein